MKDFDKFLSCLSRLIACKSVQGDKEEGAPFGREVKKAFDAFKGIAEEFGFKVKDYDGYMGEIRYGEGEEIGIIGHLDVVPAGTGWQSDPFTLTEKDGYFIGRGVCDDKAPLLACLFALNSLKNSGLSCNKTFRLFFGTNEETGWKDVDYFNGKSSFPEYGFSPDGNFPVSYAEKGIAVVKVRLPKMRIIDTVSGGTVINAVCAHAFCTLKNADIYKPIADKYGLKISGEKVESFGVSAHGSHPELGVNAIKNLLYFMRDVGEDLGSLPEYLFCDKSGLCGLTSKEGNVTLSPDLIGVDEEGAYVECDCRFPHPFTEKDLIPYFDKFKAPYNITVRHGTQYVEKDGKLVGTLLSVYNRETGENLSPISQGAAPLREYLKREWLSVRSFRT